MSELPEERLIRVEKLNQNIDKKTKALLRFKELANEKLYLDNELEMKETAPVKSLLVSFVDNEVKEEHVDEMKVENSEPEVPSEKSLKEEDSQLKGEDQDVVMDLS